MSPQMSPQTPPPPLWEGELEPVGTAEWPAEDGGTGGASANASADNAGALFGEGVGDEKDLDSDDDSEELVESPEDFELIEDEDLMDDGDGGDIIEIEDDAEGDRWLPPAGTLSDDEQNEVPTLSDLVGPDVDLDQEGSYDRETGDQESDHEQEGDEETPESSAETPPDVQRPEAISPRAQPTRVKPSRRDPAGLLDYLAGLASALPPEKKQAFMDSDVHLKLEYLRSRLSGKRGLHRDVGKFVRLPKSHNGAPITPDRLRDTLQYIGQMTRFHPDPAIANVLRSRMSRVVRHLEQAKEDRNDSGTTDSQA
jgi:hypothetical protein